MPRLIDRLRSVPRDVAAWCCYDWACSTFSTSIITVLLPVYFITLFPDARRVQLHPAGLTWNTSGEALWAYINAVYMMAAVIAAPALGAMADSGRSKKKFLAGCMAVSVLFTAGLATVTPGHFLRGAVLYMVAGFFWSAGNAFYDGFLPELGGGDGRRMDTISSIGYAAGYLGGGVMLALNAWMVARPATFGLADAAAATRVCFVLVAGWWAIFSIPLLVLVRETRKRGQAHFSKKDSKNEPVPFSFVRDGLRRVAGTLRKVNRLPELAKFLVAFLFYHTGIGTLVIEVAIFAKRALGLPDKTIVGCLLMVQFLAMPAALGFIYLARRFGSRNCIHLGLAVFTGTIIYAMQIHTEAQFWACGVLVALVLGGTQAISRSLFGSMIPPGMSAEFYGFFSIFNKVGTFVGPLAFGLVNDWTGNSRQAILFLIVFFIIGAGILLTVRVARGIEQAQAFERAG